MCVAAVAHRKFRHSSIMRGVWVLIVLFFSVSCSGAPSDELHTVYLVRHAEKAADGSKDPALTACGRKRAQSLAQFFRAVELDAIYSSDYRRTRETALPIAAAQDIKLGFYNPAELIAFALLLRELKRDVLVVGHSNTTAELAGLLIDDSNYGSFEESVYDRIYQVVLTDSGGRNHLLHQNFRCIESLPLPD